MSTMKDGIQHLVNGAIDTMDETARQLIDGGMNFNEAMKASSILTKTWSPSVWKEILGI